MAEFRAREREYQELLAEKRRIEELEKMDKSLDNEIEMDGLKDEDFADSQNLSASKLSVRLSGNPDLAKEPRSLSLSAMSISSAKHEQSRSKSAVS